MTFCLSNSTEVTILIVCHFRCPIGDDVPEQMGDILPTNCAAKFVSLGRFIFRLALIKCNIFERDHISPFQEANEGEVTSIAWLGTELFATGGSDKMVRVYRAKPGGQIEKM